HREGAVGAGLGQRGGPLGVRGGPRGREGARGCRGRLGLRVRRAAGALAGRVRGRVADGGVADADDVHTVAGDVDGEVHGQAAAGRGGGRVAGGGGADAGDGAAVAGDAVGAVHGGGHPVARAHGRGALGGAAGGRPGAGGGGPRRGSGAARVLVDAGVARGRV